MAAPALPSSSVPTARSTGTPRAGAEVILSVDSVSKSYGPVPALQTVSFELPAGEILGLLGPNGAGKSTMMKSILGLVRPEAGRISLFGRPSDSDPTELKRHIGYVPENPALYEFLTGEEYLDFVADMYGLDPSTRAPRIARFLTGLELAGHEHALISGYSLGMRQKVALTAALLHRPKLLILDEPLNGLDPRSARVVKDLLRSLASQEGVGILFSTHVLEIAQAICDRVVILDRGRVIAAGTMGSLRERAGLSGSGLEEVFLALTGTGDLGDVVAALAR